MGRALGLEVRATTDAKYLEVDMTAKSRGAHFFDVSQTPPELPGNVQHVGGGVAGFLEFLRTQIGTRSSRSGN